MSDVGLARAMTGSSAIAVGVVAHNDPGQVRRLIDALDPAPVAIHCDRATPDDVFSAMVPRQSNRVTSTSRLRTHRAAWSLVEAELGLLRELLATTKAEYVVLMSGSCYPLVSMPVLEAELAATAGQSRLSFFPLPFSHWGSRLGLDGGMWRLGLRFMSIDGRPVRLMGRPVPYARTRIPKLLSLHGGAEWKVYARDHAERLLRVLDAHPEIVRFFRSSFTPDESCVPTILNSPALIGDVAEQMVFSRPWFVEFPASADEGQDSHGHAGWLTEASFDRLKAASEPASGDRSHYDRALFARKMRSTDADLLDRIDAELRTRSQ